MLEIAPHIHLNESELEFTFIRAPGPGGQNVNKVASAVQLRFDVIHSPSLPEDVRNRLCISIRNKLTTQGELIIKASRYRTQERNKQDAIKRLTNFLKSAAFSPPKRKKTKPTFASKQQRLETKKKHGKTKELRGKKLTGEY